MLETANDKVKFLKEAKERIDREFKKNQAEQE
jgi:hypothetical protein